MPVLNMSGAGNLWDRRAVQVLDSDVKGKFGRVATTPEHGDRFRCVLGDRVMLRTVLTRPTGAASDRYASGRRVWIGMLLTAVLTAASPATSAAESIYGRPKPEPNALKMGVDLVLARPVLLAFTAVGTVLYVVSLPFALGGGNADQTADVLVKGPARATFSRCLGCVNSDETRAGTHGNGIY